MKLPIPNDVNEVPYFANQDTDGNLAVPTEQYILSAGLYVPISTANPIPSRGIGSLENIFDGTFSFANNAVANTKVYVNVPLPAVLNKDGKYKITIINPSAVTGLLIAVQNKETISSTAYYPELVSKGVNSGEDVDFIIQGLFGESSRLVISNYEPLGDLDGFTGLIRIRRL